MKQTVFRKVYTKDRLPDEGQLCVLTNLGKLFTFDVDKSAEWWLEEIELPIEEELEDTSKRLGYSNYDFLKGANYILNKLK